MSDELDEEFRKALGLNEASVIAGHALQVATSNINDLYDAMGRRCKDSMANPDLYKIYYQTASDIEAAMLMLQYGIERRRNDRFIMDFSDKVFEQTGFRPSFDGKECFIAETGRRFSLGG